jgi:addiction module HigA family antidote
MVLIPTDRAPTHPGEALKEEYLPELGLTQEQLAERLGISFRRVNEILNQKRPVTIDTALRLGRLFGQSPEFWMNLQLRYDLWHAKRSELAAAIASQVQPIGRT